MVSQTKSEQQEIAKKLANLPPEKRHLLIKLLRKEGIDLLKFPITPISRESNQFPLSWGQERLWFLNQFEGTADTYNLLGVVRITGNLQLTALQQSLNEIVKRHEVLRTSFITVNDAPIQIVAPVATCEITIEDWQHLSETADLLEQYLKREQQTLFDLTTGLLLRATLLKLSPRESILLITRHHIVWDGWSTGIFLQELSRIYAAYSQGKASPLPPLPIQYADYAAWQRQWLSQAALENQLDYWKKQLSDANFLLQLPQDRIRPPVMSYRGRTQRFSINQEFTKQLQQLSLLSESTLFMTLLAAFAVLLYRYSHQEDILIGSPIANRTSTETESLIGFFVNTLVLRVKLQGNPSFEELLHQVKEVTLSAYAHQDIPFEKVVEALNPERSLSYSPIFQVMFILQNTPNQAFELPGVTLTPLTMLKETTNFDLTLDMEQIGSELLGTWEYNTDIFDDRTIAAMSGHFQNVLAGIVANPKQAIGEIPLLSSAEQQQLLVEWNNTTREYPSDKCIHQLFESQVERTPDAVAVVFEDQQLTYQELNQKANQLAHYLKGLGVRPEVLVGICVERSLEMVVGLLGILKAGGAYVPLDPNYPSERLNYILADSGVKVLLSQNKWTPQLLENQCQVICLDSDREKINLYSLENPTGTTTDDNLAYIIYTSGSTGKPKGVMITHQSLISFTQVAIAEYQIMVGDRILQFASINFDAAVEEIYPCLCTGATLVLRTNEMLADLRTFFQACKDMQLTVLDLPTAYWHKLVDDLVRTDVTLPESLRLVIVGGEKVLPEPVRYWQQYVAKSGKSAYLGLVNTYGPTETTVTATLYRIPFSISAISEVPIGRPLPHLQAYILDQYLQPSPIGVPGELHIGGAGLARGYLNRPELTAEKFIQNPFEKTVRRLYKTGDLARYLPDGNIEYLGRIDNQVKIRGFRIELGEIEAALNTHEQIQQAVVIDREYIPGDKRLVVYVVSTSNTLLTSNQLREFLKQKLPEYMIPSAFVFLDKLPLTPNGKIDRKALPAPDSEIIRTNEYVAPHTPSQEIIANIFTKVLGVQNISIHDNFFEIGGHSLLATQLVSRLKLAFGVEIPLRTIFASPTVAQLDQTLTQLRTSGNGLSFPPIQPRQEAGELLSRGAGEKTKSKEFKSRVQEESSSPLPPCPPAPLPLSWAQERLWFLNQLEGSSATYNIPGAVHITGNLDIEALQQALSEIVCRHEILRTSFQKVDGIPVQIVHPEATMNINVVDLQLILDSERETHLQQLSQAEALTPFDLEIAPLIRCSLLLLSATEYVLLLTMHHIVSDGWSIGIFISELSALYSAFRTGEPSPLSPLAIQYADFAVWQRQWLRGEVLDTQLNYWRIQLQDTPSLLQLPTDRPRPNVQTYQGNTQTFQLNADLTQKLKILSRESGTTLFMTLQAAFATLLYRYSGEADILMGTPIANRHFQEIESLIGFFVNTLVLRTRFVDNPSFASLLVQVRETTLQAYEHQDVPFGQVVEALQPERSLSYSPLFQVMFILQNAPMGELELPDVTLTLLSTESTVAKFDLTVSMSETEAGLVGSWEYNTDLFDASTIERMGTHFQNLLSAIVENPQQTVDKLPLLSAVEQHQLLVEWNNTATAYPTDKCIHQLFEEQVEKTPLSVAVVFENQQLTYQELNQKANQLAHYLKGLGVRPEVLVGICVERSLEMVVGLLGILKAGGAYVPLDPNYPLERLSYMLRDSAVEVLLTQQFLWDALPSHNAQVVCLDTDWETIQQHSQENLDSGVCANNLVYVIYTSGSTGLPKGVMNIHQGVHNRLLWMQHSYPLTSNDRVIQKTPFSFDVSVWEFFWPLITGASIVVAQPEGHKDSSYLVQLIAQNQITTIHFVPSMLQVFLQEPDLEGCSCLRRVFCSGEALPFELMQRFFQKLKCELHNLYGPTEAAIDVTYWQCQLKADLQIVPIGHPISNTQIYILDKYMQPVPIGVTGELYIGGDGLARGYLNRPELTAEKFIQNPFEETGGRLYKTGDLARYLPDGNIEYLGRIDNQVKIRGFRIELGEIEAVLLSHPQVEQAVVIPREDTPGNRKLVAYLVTSDQYDGWGKLYSFLKSQLPDYMLPSACAVLETLPLTPNGKVDRKNLPIPDKQRETLPQGYQAPRTTQEAFLCELYTQLLGVSPIGISDNFFELGGNSLLAIRLMAMIQSEFQTNLPLAILFQSPTIAQLAQILTQSDVTISWPILVPIQSQGDLTPLFVIPGTGGNAIYFYSLVEFLDKQRPVYGLQPQGLDGQSPLEESIEQIAANYIQAIKQVQPQGPFLIAGHSFGGWIAYEMARQLYLAGEQIGQVLIIDTFAPIEYQKVKIHREEWQWLEFILTEAGSLYGKEVRVQASELQNLKTEAEQYEYSLNKLIEAGILPEGTLVKQLKGFMSVYKSNVKIEYFVQPEAATKLPIVLFRSQGGFGYEEAASKEEWFSREDWGWNLYARTPVPVEWITGDHLTMMTVPHVKMLAEKISSYLNMLET